jgi:hypothetical protein
VNRFAWVAFNVLTVLSAVAAEGCGTSCAADCSPIGDEGGSAGTPSGSGSAASGGPNASSGAGGTSANGGQDSGAR